MPRKLWFIEKHSRLDKRFAIQGPDITLYVDNDDVDQKVVARAARQLVQTMNAQEEFLKNFSEGEQ